MKRLLYAIVVLILLFSLAVYSHVAVDQYCEETITDLKNFSDKKISANTLTKSWRDRKEKMSAYVNHDFLDQISLYIGQMTLGDNHEDENFTVAHQNIETLITLIRDEQKLATHSFY